MKARHLFIFAILLFAPICSYSEVVSFFTTEQEWSFVTGLSLENGKDFAQNTAAVDFSAFCDMKELQMNAGFKFQPSQLDFTTEAIYAPTFFDRVNFGMDMVIHTNYYHDVYVEVDYLVGPYAKYYTAKKFDCMLNFLYFSKNARIFAIEDKVPWLKNDTIAFKTEFNYRPVDWVNIFLAISSYSQYRYMLFFAPDFKLGAEFDILPVFSIGTQVEVQYIDMFTLSSNLNSVDLRIYSRITLK